MTRENLAFNPSFRNGTTGYTALNGATLAVKTGFAFYGNEALQVTKPARNGAGVQSSNIAVTESLKYAYSAYVAVPPIAPKQESAGLVLTTTWLTAAGVVVSTDSTPIVTVEAGGGWERLTGVAIAPLGASWARLSISQLVAGSARQTFYVDAILFEQAAYVGGYLDNVTRAVHSYLQDAGLSPFPLPTIGGLQLRADVTLGDLVLNTIDENNVTWVCTDIDGWWGHADPDMIDIERGVADGSYDVSGRTKARTFTLEGSFLLDDPNKLTATRDRLIAATNLIRKGAWLRTNEEPTRAAFVRLNGKPKIETVNARGRTDFSIGLKAADPIRYEWNDQDPDGLSTVNVDIPPTITNYLTNPSFESLSDTGVYRTNSIANPSAEGATPSLSVIGGSGSGVTIASDALTGSGTKSYRVQTGTSTGGYEGGITPYAPATPGSRWGFSTKARLDTNTYGAHRLLSVLRFYDSNNTQLASTDGSRVDITPVGTYHRWTGTPNATTSEEYSGTTRRTNWLVDPRAANSTLAQWSGRWFGSGGAGTQTYITNATDGPADFSTYTRKTWTTAPAGNGDTGFNLQGTPIAVPAGSQLAVSGWLRPSKAGVTGSARIDWYNGNTFVSTTATPTSLRAGWSRYSIVGTAPATVTQAYVYVDVMGGTTWAAGDTLDATGGLVELSGSVGTYFDGSTITPTQGTYHSWVGTTAQSPSRENASDGSIRVNRFSNPGFENDFTGWSVGSSWTQTIETGIVKSGNKSVKLVRNTSNAGNGYIVTTASVVVGQQYSLSFWAYGGTGTYDVLCDAADFDGQGNTIQQWTAPGSQWSRITFSFTAKTSGNPGIFVRDDSNPTPANGTTLYLDSFLLEARTGVGDYFDGNTVDPTLALPTGNSQTVVDLPAIATAPANTASVRAIVFRAPEFNTSSPNEVFYLDNLILTQMGAGDSGIPAYFDGNTPVSDDLADQDFGYFWSGAPNNSYSVLGYQKISNISYGNALVRASTLWALGGTYSARISPDSSANRNAYMNLLPMVQGTLTPGNTYTLSLTAYRDVDGSESSPVAYRAYVGDTQVYESRADIPATAGTYPVSLTFTVPSSATSQSLNVYNFEPANGASVWVDNAILTSGSDIIEYFDGGSDDTDSAIYTWSGTPNLSTSLRSPGPITVGTLTNIGTTNVTGVVTLTGPLGAGSYVYNAGTGETITTTNELRGVGGAAPITNTQLTNKVATITTSVPHNLEVGDKVVISGAGKPYDSETGYRVLTAVSDIFPYTFNFNCDWVDLDPVASSGQVNLAAPDVLTLDTYQQSVVFNGTTEGNRYRVATLVDWMQFAPGDNVISFVDVPEQRNVIQKASNGTTAVLTTDAAHFLQPGETMYVNLPVSADLARKSLTSNTVTITTAADHGFSVGDRINVVSTEVSQVAAKARASNTATLTTTVLGAFSVGDTITVALPVSTAVTAKSLTSNVATLTTSKAHGFSVGDSITATFPSTATIIGKNVVAGQATLSTVESHGFAVGDSISVSLPTSATIANKFIQGTNVVLTSVSPHGYSIGDVITVSLPTGSVLTNSRSMAGVSSYLVTMNTTTAHGFASGDVVSVSTNVPNSWTVTGCSATSTTMTIITSINHSVVVGENIQVQGLSAQFNGTWVATAVSANTITYGNFGRGGTYTAQSSTGVSGTVVDVTLRDGYDGVHAIESVPTPTSFTFLYYGQQTSSSNSTVATNAGSVTNTTNAPIVGTFRLSGTPSNTQFSYQTTDTVNTGGTSSAANT